MHERLNRLLSLPSGPRSKWLVLTIGLVVVFALAPLAGKFEDVQENDPVSFLPGDSESVEALELSKRFPSGELTPAATVFRRAAGLTAADRDAIAGLRAGLNGDRPDGAQTTPPPVFSDDGTAALLVTPIRPDYGSDRLLDATNDIRDRVDSLPAGLDARVTGPAGYSTDAIEVFQQIDGALLGATAALVFVLLILIYRSPVFWLIPFTAVVAAELSSRGVGYLIAEAGVTVNGQSAGVLPVLVFGAGTDYALLLVARYREELRRHADKHDAMRVALRRAGPAIAASGATVVAALLTLSIADVNGTAGLGPIGAMGVALAMVSMLTVLPALLVVGGRRAFWPFVPRHGTTGGDETHGAWRRVADRVAVRPRRVLAGAVAVLALGAAGLTQLNSDLTTGNGFRGDVEAVEGQKILSEAFPAGANAPTTAIVRDPADAPRVRAALEQAPGVAQVGAEERGAPGVQFPLVLDRDPYSRQAFDLIPGLRRAAGDGTVIGGPTAEEHDVRTAAARDNRVVVPLALLVVFVILAILLRAIVAPLVLIGTVVASFGAALGIGAFFFEHVFGFAGVDPTLPLFAFVFLVALGVDYNIFLMARVREETLSHGTHDGMVRGLAVTGAVITSAGIVLAGTFSVLAVLPLVSLTQIGFTIAVGILLDTFIVRSLLVPALVLELGERTWWPSALWRRSGEKGRELAGVGHGAKA